MGPKLDKVILKLLALPQNAELLFFVLQEKEIKNKRKNKNK